MTAMDRVLDRVSGVKRTGAGRWIGKCPAHNDGSPSLSIRETDDGRVLLHCFGGCETENILAAINLDFGDLFDKPLEYHLPPVRGGFSARELLELLAHESMVACLIVSDLAAGHTLTDADSTRLLKAAGRLQNACDIANA